MQETHSVTLRGKGVLVIVTIIAAVFLIDLSMPLGFAAGVLYIVAILASYRLHDTRIMLVTATLCSILVVVGYYASSEGTEFQVVIVNRLLAILTIWGAAWLSLASEDAWQRLLTSELRARVIVDNAVDSMITIDAWGRIESFNPAAEKMFGYSAEEVIGQNVKLLMPEPYHGEHDRYLDSYRKTGERKIIGIGQEVVARRKDGSTFPIDLSVSETESSQVRIFAGIIRDTSKRKQAEADLLRAKEDAEQANLAKARFLASMSHELRTPLNAIIGYSEMLKEDAEADGQTAIIDDLNKINGAGKHLLQLISDILDLSKIEAGKMKLSIETVEIEGLAEEVGATMATLVAKNNNAFKLVLGDDVGSIETDPTRLWQCLLNLLSNAAKFTKDGEITLAVTREQIDTEECLLFRVIDTGIGMDAKLLENIFSDFSQSEDKSAVEYGGTGLGLAIVRELAQLLGGEIDVVSESGRGSTFTLSLPANAGGLHAKPAEGANTPARREFAIPAGSPQDAPILVVDDDEQVLELMRRQLTKEGYRVVTANNGAEALRLAKEYRPVAITLDVLMPGMDGWEVLQLLKADHSLASIPVIMCTIVDEANKGFALGANDYLTKPLDRGRLLAMLQLYCGSAPCRVLVVEDDPASRELVVRMLSAAGCSVLQAENGREALQYMHAPLPDVILLDLMMPEMNGFEFLEALQQDPQCRQVSVIVITARELSAEDHRRLNGYVTGIIGKGQHNTAELLADVSVRLE
jgi:PAS domain S-box-containing protein